MGFSKNRIFPNKERLEERMNISRAAVSWASIFASPSHTTFQSYEPTETLLKLFVSLPAETALPPSSEEQDFA